MSPARVAVTGMGVVTPVGVGLDNTWKALLSGRSGGGLLTTFDTSDHTVKIACEATEFDPSQYQEARDVRRSDRFCQMAVASAVMAVEQAGWSGLPYEAEQIGAIVGSGIGGLTTLEGQFGVLRDRGPSKVSPFAVPLLMINGAAGAIAMRYGLLGPNFATVSACATGGHALGEAARLIRTGGSKAVLAGGSESAITPLAMSAFTNMGALSKRNDDPERASRPFDLSRDGFVMGEGAGIVVLEDWDSAEARGATILAELAGYGATCDAFHLTQPHPEGAGAAGAMRQAMADAGVEQDKIGYINAHGTSTFADRIETAAIKSVFGSDAPPVSSTKSATGHLLGAAGVVEAIFCIQALRDGQLPPTINYATPDPDCDLDYVPNEARAAKLEYAMSNSFGFGGHNACLVLRRV